MELDHADNVKALSDASENLDLTRQQRSDGVEFLRNLRLTCEDIDKQWQERSKTRADETKAVAEALAILREDDNRELTARAVSFLQEASVIGGLHGAGATPADFDAGDLIADW